MMLPLLKLTADGKIHTTPELRDVLAKQYKLTDEELQVMVASGRESVYRSRFGWARDYLNQAGLLKRPVRGQFQVTDDGLALLKENPERIDNAMLRQRYQSFRDFWARSTVKKVTSAQAPVSAAVPAVDEQTPDELIASAYEQMSKQTQAELLSKLMACSPAYFEWLVVKLLVKMGYGGSLDEAEAALLTGKSGDGGIDGVIKQDPLGLEKVYVQAKRYTETNVGRPAVQGFVGALDGKRKGILFTTSSFSKEARDYAAKSEKAVILVDGAQIAELMFEHELGVSTERTYKVKRIENDFFDEE
jgi:restriction system protein